MLDAIVLAVGLTPFIEGDFSWSDKVPVAALPMSPPVRLLTSLLHPFEPCAHSHYQRVWQAHSRRWSQTARHSIKYGPFTWTCETEASLCESGGLMNVRIQVPGQSPQQITLAGYGLRQDNGIPGESTMLEPQILDAICIDRRPQDISKFDVYHPDRGGRHYHLHVLQHWRRIFQVSGRCRTAKTFTSKSSFAGALSKGRQLAVCSTRSLYLWQEMKNSMGPPPFAHPENFAPGPNAVEPVPGESPEGLPEKIPPDQSVGEQSQSKVQKMPLPSGRGKKLPPSGQNEPPAGPYAPPLGPNTDASFQGGPGPNWRPHGPPPHIMELLQRVVVFDSGGNPIWGEFPPAPAGSTLI